MRFPFYIDMDSPEFYFNMFEAGYWTGERSLLLISDSLRKETLASVLNSRDVLSEIAQRDFGLVLDYSTGSPKINRLVGSSLSSVQFANKIGYYVQTFLKVDENEESLHDYILIHSNKITISDEYYFKNSTSINGIYNIIAVYIILLAKRDNVLVSLIDN